MQETPLSDEELVRLVLNGEISYFDRIISRYRDKVAGLIYSVTNSSDELEDIAQEVFLAVYRNLSSFQSRSQLGTWIYRITVNKCRDWQRKTYARRPAEFLGLLGGTRASPQEQSIGPEDRDAVREAIKALPDKYRTVIVLYYYHDLTCQEIANILAIPKKTVETRLMRGRGIISRQIDWDGGEAACWETKRI
jgi:RNA polymerase sigma-70 factor (ECF subfamily)